MCATIAKKQFTVLGFPRTFRLLCPGHFYSPVSFQGVRKKRAFPCRSTANSLPADQNLVPEVLHTRQDRGTAQTVWAACCRPWGSTGQMIPVLPAIPYCNRLQGYRNCS